jgi:hypothetical protein
MKRLIFYITTGWGDDEAMSTVANKIEPHLQDRDYILDLLSRCEVTISMGEHSKIEKGDDDDSCND